jgi:hypothetical protein
MFVRNGCGTVISCNPLISVLEGGRLSGVGGLWCKDRCSGSGMYVTDNIAVDENVGFSLSRCLQFSTTHMYPAGPVGTSPYARHE